jgi:hypothetical protein
LAASYGAGKAASAALIAGSSALAAGEGCGVGAGVAAGAGLGAGFSAPGPQAAKIAKSPAAASKRTGMAIS